MRIFYLFIILCVSSIFIAGSCSRDFGPQVLLREINRETKSFTAFKVGSYWIYEDSATGIIDSVSVTNFDEVSDTNYIDEDTWILNSYEMTSYSSFYNKNFLYKPIPRFNLDTAKYANDLTYRTKKFALDTLGRSICYFLYRGNSQSDKKDYGDITFLGYLSYITLAQKKYYSIRLFKTQNDATENNSETIYYWAKNIGIIKKEIADGKTWILKDHNVIQ